MKSRAAREGCRSGIEPVAQFDEKHVARRRGEDAAEVATEVEPSLIDGVLAPLLPDDEEGGAWLVLPAQHVGRPERTEVEVGIRAVRVRLVAILVAIRAAVDQLLERVVIARRRERLRVHLDREL